MRLLRWTRRLVAIAMLMLAISLPVAVFSPFTAGDYVARGETPPTTAETLLWLVPVEIILILLVFVIDPKKAKREN